MLKGITTIALIICSLALLAQDYPDNLKVVIDCDPCDDDQIRQQISSGDYVYDKFQANLHLLITQQGTGSGGREIKVSFIPRGLPGLETFTLTTHTSGDATRDMVREKILGAIRYGLTPFLFSTGQEELAKVEIDKKAVESENIRDPFNYWVFSIRASGNFDAEDSQRESEAGAELEASRITEIWRIESEAGASYDFKQAESEDREIISEKNERWIRASSAYSISSHWSTGIEGGWQSDTYENLKSHFSIGPGIEYNVFPWKESDRRMFTIAYHLKADKLSYFEETIYDQLDETLARQSLRVEIEIIQPWGDFEVDVEAQNYLHDFNRYSLSYEADLGIRIFKGLSVFINTEARAIHDQLYLPKGNSTIEDILIQRRKQATSFELGGRLGFRYTFGSIYNNVVNRRL